MKYFLKKIIIYLTCSLTILTILDFSISKILEHSNELNGEYEVWNDIYKGKINSEISIYGSSRAWVQFNSKILEKKLNKKTYNFGLDGHNFWLQYLRHKEYLKNNLKPQIILLSIDVFTLQKGKNLYQMNQFLPFMFYNQTIEYYTSSYKGFTKSDFYFPFIRYCKKQAVFTSCYNVLKNKNQKKFRINGYKGIKMKWTNDLKNAIEKRKKYFVKIDKPSLDLFKNFIVECKKNKIKLVLVYAPEYIEGQKFIENRNEIVNFYKKTAKTFNLKYLDYSNSHISFDKSYFYNSEHLNFRGSNLFTNILAKDLSFLK